MADKSVLTLTDDEWNMLASICEDWLDDRLDDHLADSDRAALARRIIAAAEGGNA